MSEAGFYFDPTCPWAWMSSRWISEAAALRGFSVRWHLMSLPVLNEGRELSEEYAQMMARAWQPSRLFNGVRITRGEHYLKPLYDAFGSRIHPGGRRDEPYAVTLAESLAEVGLPASDLSLADDASHDDSLRAAQAEAEALVGADVGTPVVSFDGVAFFGPVVSPAPKGEAAALLWDGCLLLARTDGFFELKRTRTRGPDFS